MGSLIFEDWDGRVEACSKLIFGIMRSPPCSPSICTLPPPSYHTSSLSSLFVEGDSSSMFRKIQPLLPSHPPASHRTDPVPGREADGSHTTIDIRNSFRVLRGQTLGSVVTREGCGKVWEDVRRQGRMPWRTKDHYIPPAMAKSRTRPLRSICTVC